MSQRRRVVVVTGGGGGIGAAIAEELGRRGRFVVTVDPLVTLDGAEQLPEPEETTASRIVAAGGSARASSISVTDGDAVRGLFEELVDEHGGLDGVVNVAGITRPTGFATGTEEDWRGVLEVHLGGYLNVLRAALPIMAAAGHGRIVGVTSGSGWRPADAGAYSSAKRAVAALTWQLGKAAPPDVAVNAISPIAATRMVAAALARAGGSGGGASGGLSLSSMPSPEDLGPFGAHVVEEGFGWCRGQVLFAGGAEVAVVDPPRLLEVARLDRVPSAAHVLDALLPAWIAAEAAQASGGGTNPRFGTVFDDPPGGGDDRPSAAGGSCLVITDRPSVAKVVGAALDDRGIASHVVDVAGAPGGFAGAAEVLDAVVGARGPVDGIVVAIGGGDAVGSGGWEGVLAEHDDLPAGLHADAAWRRAVAEHAATTGRSVRLVTLTDAATAGGRSRAQAAAQLARVGRKATDDRVTPFAIAVEGGDAEAAALAATLLAHPEAAALAGAELAAGDGWAGLRSHPRPIGSTAFGGPAVPEWLDGTLRQVVEAR